VRGGRGIVLAGCALGLAGFVAGCSPPSAMSASPGLGACQQATFVGTVNSPAIAVRWTSPDDRDDVDALAPWCRTIGPALVQAAPGHRAPAQVDSFAIVSWNQHVGAGDLRRLVADLRRGALTGGVPVDQFVLLLQEVYRGGALVPTDSAAVGPVPDGIRVPPPDGGLREDVRELARDLGLSLFYAPSMRNGIGQTGEDPEDRGNAILSTMALDSFRVVTLPFERERRAGLVATLRVPSGEPGHVPVRVATVHLDVFPALLPSLLDGRRRIRQATAFASVLDSSAAPLLVGADLNALSPGDPQVKYFRSRWPQIDPPAQCRSRGPFCSDYLFAGAMDPWELGGYRILPDTYGSDHHPLVALATRRSAVALAR